MSTRKFFKENKLVLIGLCMTVPMLGLGTWLLYYFSYEAIDYDLLHELLTTNQTHIDSLACDDVQIGIVTIDRMILNKPTQIKEDLHKIAVDKKCPFIIEEIGK